MSTRDDNQAPFDWAPPIEREERRTPSPASTAGERQSIDTPEFQKLMAEYGFAGRVADHDHTPETVAAMHERYRALIAHIDTWAGRSAGDAVPVAWQWRHRLKGDKGWGAWTLINKGRYDRRADYPNSEFRELFAAPAPGNTAGPAGDA